MGRARIYILHWYFVAWVSQWGVHATGRFSARLVELSPESQYEHLRFSWFGSRFTGSSGVLFVCEGAAVTEQVSAAHALSVVFWNQLGRQWSIVVSVSILLRRSASASASWLCCIAN